MSSKTIAIRRGDSATLDVSVLSGRSAYSLAGATVYFTAKESRTDADTAAVIRKSSGGLGGVTITDAAGGLAEVTVNPADTSSLAAREYVLHYDVQVKTSGGAIYTVAEGTVVVLPDVTISTS